MVSETLLGRVAVAGLLVALAVVGCGSVETGGPGEAGPGLSGGVTTTPNPGSAEPSIAGSSNAGSSNPGSSNPGSSNPGSSNPGSSNPGSSNPGGLDGDPADPSSGDTRVAWVPPGPGNEFPRRHHGHAEDRWYKALSDHDCDAIAALGRERGQRQLYAGLGDACRAALKKDDRLWTSAEVAWRQVSDPTDCLDRSALRLLRDLVMAHQRAPHAHIDIVNSPSGAACDSDRPTLTPTPESPSPTPESPSPTPESLSEASQIRATAHYWPRPLVLAGWR
jgi:hypothetical protein